MEEIQYIEKARKSVGLGIQRPGGWEGRVHNFEEERRIPRGRGRAGAVPRERETDPSENRLQLIRRKTIELEKERWENRFQPIQLNEEEDEESEKEYVFGHGEVEEAAIKRVSKLEQKANRRLVAELRKRNEDELLHDLASLLEEKGAINDFEEVVKKRKQTRPSYEEEFKEWNERQAPDWHMPISPRSQGKLRRKREMAARRQEEARIFMEEWENSKGSFLRAFNEREKALEAAQNEREEEDRIRRMEELKKGPFGHLFGSAI